MTDILANVIAEVIVAIGAIPTKKLSSVLWGRLKEHFTSTSAADERDRWVRMEQAVMSEEDKAVMIRDIARVLKDQQDLLQAGTGLLQQIFASQAELIASHAVTQEMVREVLEIVRRADIIPHPTPAFPFNNLPFPRNPLFTGREEELKQIEGFLKKGEAAAITQAALYGLGGVGKTQTALEYAYRHEAEYDIVWWVKSETSASLSSDYAGLAAKLHLPEAEAREQAITVEAVKLWLHTHDRWLLIFDNANHPDEIESFLPGGKGQVLITSRDSDWVGVAKPLSVEVWPEDKAVEFILNRTERKDDPVAHELVRELGYLPLALEQAGAYITRSKSTFAVYLQQFREKHTKLFGHIKAKPGEKYKQTVETTWKISFENVKQECAASIDLMNLCAFMAPDDIPETIIRKGAEHLPASLAGHVQDNGKFNDLVAPLLGYSLIKRAEGKLSLHRLVQAVLQDQLSKEEQKLWAGAGLKVVNEAFPGDVTTNPNNWPLCKTLLPHAQAAANHAERLSAAPEETGRLLNQAALYLEDRAQYAEAKLLYERAIRIDEATYGPDHPTVAIRVNNLGAVLKDLGNLKGAKDCFERALPIFKQHLGEDHPNVATLENNLGSVLQDLGDLKGAKDCYERALKIEAAINGKDHPQVAIYVNNLGGVLQDLDDLKGAKECFERALKIGEATYGPNHPKVAIRVNNLGNVLNDLGDLKGAKEYYERALKIEEAINGKDHPQVAIYVNNLGGVLAEEKDLRGAKECFERAYRIRLQFLGPEHPDTKSSKKSLERVQKKITN